jgi:hypothetical protein
METAKVDIRKLQLLNDRINQTIEALNQVRLSVHGISHTGPIPGQLPINGSYGVTAPYLNVLGVPQQVPSMVPGMSHTSALNPFGYNNVNPLFNQLWGAPQGISQFNVVGQPGLLQSGLLHSSPDTIDLYTRAIEPTFARIAQTFPFVQWGYSPFGQSFSQIVPGIY